MVNRAAGYGYIVLAAVCWGLLGPVARWALAEGVLPLEIAFWRAVIGGALFLGHMALTRARTPPHKKRAIARRHWPVMIAFGLVGVSLFYSSYQFAVERGGAALAAVLLYTAPAWVALIGWWGLDERITPLKLVAVALTLLGVGSIALSGAQSVHFSVAAIAWGLVSGISYALYYPFGKRYFARYVPATIFAVALPIGALGLWPIVSFGAKSAEAWLALGFIGAVSTYGAYLAYGAGLQRLEASRASIVATLEPVIAAAVAHGWWDERFGPWGYAGAVLVIAAALMAAAAPDASDESPTPADPARREGEAAD